MKCHNCSNQAMFLVGPEDARCPLCLDCHAKFVQTLALQNDMLEREMNYLVGMAEATVGFPGILPRFPQRQVVQMGDITLNNIKIDRSTIGVLNTGTIGTVDAAVTALQQTGDTASAQIFKSLTEAVARDRQLTPETKNQILDLLSLLSTEATAPRERRRSGAMLPLLEKLSNLLSGAAALAQLWAQYGPALQRLFS